MSEREAFYAAIEASPEDWGLYLIFADWLRDRGEDDLADGFAAMGRLRVRVNPECIYNGLNSFFTNWKHYERDVMARRQEGSLWFVTDAWYSAASDISEPKLRKKYGGSEPGPLALPDYMEATAIAYARLTQEQKAEAERLLAPQEEHACPFSPDRRPTPT